MAEITHKESDSPIVPMKPVMTEEERGGHMERSADKTPATPEVERAVRNEWRRIAEGAKKHGKLDTLIHYVNKESLMEEHRRQRSGKAKGVDGMDKEAYEVKVEENIEDLIQRMKRFSYHPQAVRRTYIPKVGSDKKRPLGIPAYEDKLVQGAVRRILDEIYEGKFYGFSYGFRRGKSCHQALHEVNQLIMTKRTNYLVDADIQGFFDNVNHERLMEFLSHDIGDKKLLRLIARFLKAGIMEEGRMYESDKGTPQGGLISPVLANVYLHYALDMWFEVVVKKQSRGEAYIVRYADDFVCLFQYEEDAVRFYEALGKRLDRFGLKLSSEKSKIMRFGRFAKQHSRTGKTETFDFLGITHINGMTRTGRYRVIHRTSKKKLKAKRTSVREWLRENMHEDTVELIKKVNQKLAGHYAYYGISGNYAGIYGFYRYVIGRLHRTLNRRSQKGKLSRRQYSELLKNHPIVEPKICVDIW